MKGGEVMCSCCCGSDSAISCQIESTDKGYTITLTSDDPKKAEALKKLAEAKKELCCDSGCC